MEEQLFKLISWLSNIAPEVWEAAKHKAVSELVPALGWVILALVVMIVGFVSFKICRREEQYSESYSSRESDFKIVWACSLIIMAFAFVVFLIASLTFAKDIISLDYSAIESLRKLIK